MGFRPLYLAGSAWALISVLLWVRAFAAARRMNGLAWHAHEMLWGFVATIAVASCSRPAPTGPAAIRRGNALAALCLVWLARALPGSRPSGLPAGGHRRPGFFPVGAAALGRSVWLTRNKRNYGVPLLAALASAHLLPDGRRLRRLPGPDALLQRRPAQHGRADPADRAACCPSSPSAPWPAWTFRRIPGRPLAARGRRGRHRAAADRRAKGAALALAASGLIALVQWLAWKPWAARRVPLLWILYTGYLGLSIGLLVGAAQLAGLVVRVACPRT